MQWLRRYLIGIYGADALNQVAMTTGLICLAIASYFKNPLGIFVSFLPVAYAIFRTFSHHSTKRKKENEHFLRFWRPIEKKMILGYTFLIDRGKYQYQTCPKCAQLLRLPKTKQALKVTCPKCKTVFKIKSS